jgi:hypothetical protein
MKHDFAHKWAQNPRVFSMPTLARRLLVLTMLISLVGLSACVSTPTTPPVAGKQQSISERVHNNTQNTNLLQGVPQTYTYHATQGAVTLNVNAQVQLPPTTKIPITSVQPTCFDQDTTNKMINTFMQGKPLYEPIPSGTDLPKAYLEKLLTLQQALQLPGAQGDKEISTQPYAILNVLDPSSLQPMIANAPDTMPQPPQTGQLLMVPDNTGLGNSAGIQLQSLGANGDGVAANSGKGYDMILKVVAETAPTPGTCVASFSNNDITSVYNYAELTGNASARGMHMSLAQAKTLAQHTLQAIGANELQLTDVQLASLIPLTRAQNPNTTDQAYGLWFTRHVAGVPTTLDLTKPSISYAKSYLYERAFMLINDSGVIEFSWNSPMHASGTVSSNANIRSFQDAMSTFQQQFFIHYAQSTGHTTYTINRITLGLMRVQVKDQDAYLMVPVWDFFGSINPQPSNDDPVYTPSLQSLLTVNAIDGTIIDRTLGY